MLHTITKGLHGRGIPSNLEQHGTHHGACCAQVTVDNSTASSYSSFIIACPNRKGLLYDIFRTFTDVQVRVAYGKVAVKPPNNFEAELFVQEVDGARILDP